MTRALPLVLLLAYGIGFASITLGRSLLGFDDHPGQLFRVWHVVTHGAAPWAWNSGWWAGYPELQFYPPLYAYVGGLVHVASAGSVSVPAAYQLLLWVAYLAPGVTVFALLARVLGSGWAALPAAFIALTLSGSISSGVEGGVRIGMAPARLAWALLPLLLLALVPWIEGRRRWPWTAAPLIAAITLMHPAHLPAAVVLIALAAVCGAHARWARLRTAVVVLALAAALTAFWTVPLLARIAHTRALAWREVTVASMLATLTTQPLLVALIVLAPAALIARTAVARVVAWAPWAVAVLVALDAFVVEPLGLRSLPADRVMDSMWLAFILAAALGVGTLVARRPWPPPAVAGAALVVLVVLGATGQTLALRPRAGSWPSLTSIERGVRLGDLWSALEAAPPGRVLFVRSGIPLVYGTAWYRPHTHATALTPLFAGRDIVNGTFTHPSPIAALVYRGSAGPGAITDLVERLDGQSLFGQPLAELDAAAFNRYAERLDIAAVVALDEDAGRLRMLEDNAHFAPRPPIGPFVLHVRTAAGALARPVSHDRWTMAAPAVPGWTPTGIAYYPLWRASAGATPLATRRGVLGDLEVEADGRGARIELRYAAGLVEYAGVAVSGVAVVAWLLLCLRDARVRKEEA